MKKSIKKYITDRHFLNKSWLIIRWTYYHLMSKHVSDIKWIRYQYKRTTGKILNLRNPRTFNEKIQWLKLYWRADIAAICADKYAVRNYVKHKVGENILNTLYGVFEKVSDIDFKKLPEKFVMKTTHGNGQNFFCTDKKTIKWKEIHDILELYMSVNYYNCGREWAYKNIVPKIICEEYLEENGQPPKDYKFFCFNGVPKFIQVDSDRFTKHARNFYDLEWDLLNFELIYERSLQSIPQPARLREMVEYASMLAMDIPFVRIDFYYLNDKIYFGEMTFYPEGGTGRFIPPKYDDILGSYLQLPNVAS